MSEKETRRLHELAAKAVGLSGDYRYCNSWDGMAVWNDTDGGWFDWRSTWRPLVDDGDSRRLEVALDMIVDNFTGEVRVKVGWSYGSPNFHTEHIQTTGNRAYATRLAVLRAAAVVGETMMEMVQHESPTSIEQLQEIADAVEVTPEVAEHLKRSLKKHEAEIGKEDHIGDAIQ